MALPGLARAQVTAFNQAVATAAAGDRDIAGFYKAVNYEGIWTGKDDRARRAALISALERAGDHGLPTARFSPDALKAKMDATKDPAALGRLEVEISALFLDYARSLQTGLLTPSRIDEGLVREVPYRARQSYLVNLMKSDPRGFFNALAPRTPEYTRLMKEKLRLETLIGRGGWGPTVAATKLEPGASGPSVIALRDRLAAMGFIGRSATQTYDAEIQSAVQQFQLAHGLSPDGVAGSGTLKELNASPERRLQSVIVAMERERWFNRPRGKRHVLVNLTDFKARIIDNNAVTFETRTVVGANQSDRRSPEFSDVMEFLVINPSWYVPRSIATKEYLPMLQENPNAVRHLEITDSNGRRIDRSAVDFTSLTEKTFPFAMREPPSQGNALGIVKFMFPNRYNIYLHDTPAKSLFSREVRAYSHGCIRLAEPREFAYALLARQTADPQGYFQSVLATGRETRVNLKQPVPVHIIYRTAYTQADGRTQFRRDVYGRDARIWAALAKEGVALRSVQG
ncbi:L,D-transpeptidase family protein [Poseidonocella sedimentorum]|nr:L,D-transpeptidase family protein [Poseidonocella sedimentorum]